MDKLRVAVIGTGFVGRVHVENIRRQHDAELMAIADQSEQLATSFGKQLGITRAVGNYHQFAAGSSHRRSPYLHSQRDSLSNCYGSHQGWQKRNL